MIDLERTVDAFERMRPVQTETTLCVRSRSPKATCSACVEACPVGAMTLNRGPVIDYAACTACGLCTAACPTGAVRLETPSPVQVLNESQKITLGDVILTCPSQAAELPKDVQGRVVRIPCIGILTPELLASLVGVGHTRPIIWQPSACETCPNGAAALRQVAQAVWAVEALYPGKVVLGTDEASLRSGAGEARTGGGEVTLAGEDRRAFLGSALRGSGGLLKAVLGEWLFKPPAEAPKASPFETKGLPARRQMLRTALTTTPAAPGAQLPERAVRAAKTCALCPVCSRLCPFGAIELAKADDRATLRWRASHCTGCGLCEKACPVGAIERSEPMLAGQFLQDEPEEIAAGVQTTCACGKSYWRVDGGPDRCVACRMAEERVL